MKLKTASLSFNSTGTPTSAEFDDVYFSNDNGLAESKYVFFDHNQLNSRWFSHNQSGFNIAETGFGTGLNFLLTWQLFREFQAQASAENKLKQLYFISTEKFPIEPEQLKQALQQWPQLQELSEQLLVQYPVLTPGCHRLSFDQDSIILDLWLGDINDNLPKMMTYPDGIVDAWYLDGFAPSKNMDMWQTPLFSNMARLSKSNATFATFTAAGIVKRGLREHGFVVKKSNGFGRKRDMLNGYYAPEEAKTWLLQQQTDNPANEMVNRIVPRPLAGPYQRGSKALSNPSVAIIGAGLAGANLAVAMQQKGYKTTLYCAEAEPAMGASGNHIGGFYPALNADFSLHSQLYCHAFSFATRFYSQLAKSGFNYGHDWCGVFFPGFSEEVRKRQQNLLHNNLWPESLVHYVNNLQATSLCNVSMPYDGLFIPLGGWINPKELVNALLDKAQALGATVKLQHCLQSLTPMVSGWQMQWQSSAHSQADIVILATGAESRLIPQLQGLPFNITRGQVEQLPCSDTSPAPATVICHKGYFTPFHKQVQAMGATFDKASISTEVSDKDTLQNYQTIRKALANCDWVEDLPQPVSRRAALRIGLPDHKPIMGAVPNLAQQQEQYAELYKAHPIHSYPVPENHHNLFVLTGLGSHGLCSSPLLAETLACQISGQPLPLNQDLLASLSPNRFLVRNLIRRNI